MTLTPWYRRTLRWGQTNLTEIDPLRYDDAWWRKHWRETSIQGVIVNAGGIVAYYPSKFELHHRAEKLGQRDLYGEIVTSARAEGLTVIARMDSNRVASDFATAHPDWICRDIAGNPIQVADKYVTCINSPYYSQYLPQILTEIIERSHPDGFADNSWAGLPRSAICYCRHCTEQFAEATGHELPPEHDWDDDGYRAWIDWNYQRRTDLWELNNRVTTRAGGPDCLWFGMLSGDVLNNSQRFIDLRQILRRSELIMLDHQRRNAVDGFEHNIEAGRRLHELLGWDKLIPESTPQYQNAVPAFRVAAMPPAEVRLWATAGFAGGIQPWWHHIGAQHDDRRQYQTAAPLFSWHRDNIDILIDRTPVADVGVVWSQRNHDLGGRHRASALTLDPYRGITRALTAGGISWLPVHADDLAGAAERFSTLVLPNLVVISDTQLTAIRDFLNRGGSLIATGESGRLDDNGRPRSTNELADLFEITFTDATHGSPDTADPNIEVHERHSYLRLAPELRAGIDGPADSSAPVPTGVRHPVLFGLDDTDLIPFGGYLPIAHLRRTGRRQTDILATLVPDFPIYPPETSWMQTPSTDIPAVVAGTTPNGGRLIWLLADLDRCFARDHQPDHATIISSAARWAIGDRPTLTIQADGLATATHYRQGNTDIVHLTNRVTTTTIPGRETHLVPIGPITVRLRSNAPASTVNLRVAGTPIPAVTDGEYVEFCIDHLLDHEVAVLHSPKLL